MKLLILSALLISTTLTFGADPSRLPQSPSYYDLLVRWANRPIAEIQTDAERNDAVAQFYLGKLLMLGRGVPRDEERGVMLLKRAVEQNNTEAMTELARCHYLSIGMPQNSSEALRLAREAAARSNAAGINLLGFFYTQGVGVTANAVEALRLFRQSAEAGNPTAMRNIGAFYLQGQAGLSRDATEANHWYLRAAELGHANCMVAYGESLLTGRGITKDTSAAFKWFVRAANAGDSSGLQPMTEDAQFDFRTALAALRRAAILGDSEAQFRLAKMIATGEIESSGPEEIPHQLLQAAAEGDHIEAALMLGDRYRWGYGGPRDLIAASRWFLRGHSRARFKSTTSQTDPVHPAALSNWFYEDDNIRPQHTPEDLALATALSYYSRAAWKRDPEAMREIAKWYQRGLNVPKDPQEAAAWLLLAQQSGSSAVGNEVDVALKLLSPEQQEQTRKRVRHLLKRAM